MTENRRSLVMGVGTSDCLGNEIPINSDMSIFVALDIIITSYTLRFIKSSYRGILLG